MLCEFGRRDDASSMVHQERQKPVFQRRQRDGHTTERNTHLACVQKQRSGSQHGRSLSRRAAENCAQPCQQLFHLERFWKVVVGTGVDALDALGPPAPGRQYQHGKPARIGSPPSQNREAVELWQAQVKYGDVIVLDVAREPGLFAIPHDIDRHPRGFKSGGDVGGDTWLIFNKKDLHQSAPSPRMTTPAPASTSTVLRRPSEATT